jgi:hypothetical protein
MTLLNRFTNLTAYKPLGNMHKNAITIVSGTHASAQISSNAMR